MQTLKNGLAVLLFLLAVPVIIVAALLQVMGGQLNACADQLGEWCDKLAPELGKRLDGWMGDDDD